MVITDQRDRGGKWGGDRNRSNGIFTIPSVSSQVPHYFDLDLEESN